MNLLLKLVSFLECVLLVYFGTGLLDGDLYKIFFLCCSLLKHITVATLKTSFKYSALTRGFNIRPQNAENCNTFNTGGIIGPLTTYDELKKSTNNFQTPWNHTYGRPGMPSGHTTLITMYFILHLLNVMYVHLIKKKIVNVRSLTLLIVLFFCFATIGYSRIYLKCHTLDQVTAGYIVGIMLGVICFYVSCLLQKNISFNTGFHKFYSSPNF
jgi:membrane-associated phospholipid phosphatase